MEQIKWKPVKGFEDFYEVSEDGRIKTIERVITLPSHSYLKKERILTQFKDGRGYMHVKLYDGKGKPKSLCIHRIVASTFILNDDKTKLEVNHIDGNKSNNCVSNLEWCTRGENIKHAYTLRDPESYKGSGNKNSKLTEDQVINIREEYRTKNFTYKQLADKYKVGVTLIGYIINNKVWNHV